MESRYDDAEAARFVAAHAGRCAPEVALRVYTSRLLGSDPALVLHGGGNTSVKATTTELTGESVEVVYVKGSGWDLASIEPQGFPACRLEPLRRACLLEQLSDEDMVKVLRSQMLDPASPTPSVEALLHAFLPARFVDHTHADAVLAVVDQPDSHERARRVWPSGLVFVPYVMPGFALARAIAELGAELAKASVMVLDKHGIFTWGESAKESYERMIEAVSAAERALSGRPVSVTVSAPPEIEDRRRRQQAMAPVVRGAIARAADGQRMVLSWRDEPAILELLGRPDAEKVTRIGTVTPDHVIRIKPVPCWLGGLDGENPRAAIEAKLSDYAAWYDAYFERCTRQRAGRFTRLDRLPRVLLVPGLGALCAGKTGEDARIAGDVYAHTAEVINHALRIGEYRPVFELDLFDVEYWSLEQAKLKLAKGGGAALERRIALVTGAAGGIGLATAERLLELGAHVMLVDRKAAALEAARERLAARYAARVAAIAADVTQDRDVENMFAAVTGSFGGLDLVVSNAGTAPQGRLHELEGDALLKSSLEINLLSHQRVARHASEIMIAQGIGGCLLFNASKSAFNPGPDFGPYAVPKAGLVALMRQYAIDLAASGVRANAVNADRIRTELFADGVLEARARARGIAPDEYFQQNLLQRETSAFDVADAFAWLARAEATTGCVVTVDGGNAAAFPR
jgi:rhamnose utilization protein RhaD (predicted bifunctional aldolase and dehydrogenase)/NAD(P)-dependent dehydrogenase (short-subunit alcohol dehydrogenase family)